MPRRLIAAAALAALCAALPAVAAAPQTAQPGQMTVPRVWVQNRGRDEAVPVDLSASTIQRPLRVHISNGEAGDAATVPLAMRAAQQAWDYDVVLVPGGGGAGAAMNARGGAGWEAVGVMGVSPEGTSVLMKRPR